MRLVLCLSAAAAAFLATLPARAEDACTTFKWPMAREQAALTAAGPPSLASGAAYPALGQAVAVTLQPQAQVAYTVAPRRAPKASPAYGAELTLAAVEAGTLEVAMSGEAWVDAVQNGRVLRSSDFSGKTGCPGLRKVVRFSVAAGTAVLAISDAAAPEIRLDVDRVP